MAPHITAPVLAGSAGAVVVTAIAVTWSISEAAAKVIVLRSYMVLASHSGSCEHGCGDQCSRQTFKVCHSVFPFDMKRQPRLAPYGNGEAIKPIKGTYPHVVSTPREVGGSRDHEFRRLVRHPCLTRAAAASGNWLNARRGRAPQNEACRSKTLYDVRFTPTT